MEGLKEQGMEEPMDESTDVKLAVPVITFLFKLGNYILIVLTFSEIMH